MNILSHSNIYRLIFFLLIGGIDKPFSFVTAQSAKQIDSLFQVLQNTKLDTAKVLIMCELGTQLAELDSAKAFIYAKTALQIAQKNNYAYGEGYATHIIGYIHDYNYNYATAIEYYQKSLKIKELANDISGVAASFQNIGAVNFYQKNYEKALDYYQKAIEKRRLIGDSLGVASVYNNMAAVHRRRKNYEKALDLYLKSLKIKEQLNDVKGIANSYSNLSTLFQYKEDYNTALVYEEKALAIEKQFQNTRGIAHSLMSIGHIFYWKGDYAKAAAKIRDALVWADTARAYDVLARGYGSLSEIDSLLHNIPLAYMDYKKYVHYKDMAFKEKEKDRISVLQTIYETEKKEKNLEISQKENEILQQKNTLQAQIIQFWILLTTAIFLLLGLLLNQYRIKQKNYQQLREKNNEIEKSLAEKELLLKEIHHRVKNNLQIVSGLLHWQSQQSDDEGLKKTVQEGKNRLKSMAMIHQRLYQEDNLKAIFIQEYIHELVEELLKTYGLDKQQIDIQTNIQPLLLDVDTMIPLGLILTELISNAIKHAFPTEHGKLEISVEQKEEILYVKIADNGIGLDEKEKQDKQKQGKGFGLRLVETLAQKIDAQLSIVKEVGTEITLIVNKFKTYKSP